MPVASPGTRPFWSVMVPTYNPPAHYLEMALQSVLHQDLGADHMQIEVVDDCSSSTDVEHMVKSISKGRIAFSKTSENLGLAGCWNQAIERARGTYIHILHQDDYVLPGFYGKLSSSIKAHPEAGLFAVRSFFVDEQGIIFEVSQRLKELENGGRDITCFFYGTPIQCSGVVVKRDVYETHGAFRMDLNFTLDCEMWGRAISLAGGVVLPDVLSCYRFYPGNQTKRLQRMGEALRDIGRLNQIWSQQHPGFDAKKGYVRIAEQATRLAESFTKNGDPEAARANLDFMKQHVPLALRWRKAVANLARQISG